MRRRAAARSSFGPDKIDAESVGRVSVPVTGSSPPTATSESTWPGPTERAGAFGPFVRSLVGIHRAVVGEAFTALLDESRFSVEQIRFISLIVYELTANGTMELARLYEAPYVDHDYVGVIFPGEFEVVIDILRHINARALRSGVG